LRFPVAALVFFWVDFGFGTEDFSFPLACSSRESECIGVSSDLCFRSIRSPAAVPSSSSVLPRLSCCLVLLSPLAPLVFPALLGRCARTALSLSVFLLRAGRKIPAPDILPAGVLRERAVRPALGRPRASVDSSSDPRFDFLPCC
jgi:hypothetical protein